MLLFGERSSMRVLIILVSRPYETRFTNIRMLLRNAVHWMLLNGQCPCKISQGCPSCFISQSSPHSHYSTFSLSLQHFHYQSWPFLFANFNSSFLSTTENGLNLLKICASIYLLSLINKRLVSIWSPATRMCLIVSEKKLQQFNSEDPMPTSQYASCWSASLETNFNENYWDVLRFDHNHKETQL